MPEWYVNEPVLFPMDEFYLTAFYKLSTCRHRGEVTGEIPWTAIDRYAVRKGLPDEILDLFEFIIGELDGAYLEWGKPKKHLKKPGK